MGLWCRICRSFSLVMWRLFILVTGQWMLSYMSTSTMIIMGRNFFLGLIVSYFYAVFILFTCMPELLVVLLVIPHHGRQRFVVVVVLSFVTVHFWFIALFPAKTLSPGFLEREKIVDESYDIWNKVHLLFKWCHECWSDLHTFFNDSSVLDTLQCVQFKEVRCFLSLDSCWLWWRTACKNFPLSIFFPHQRWNLFGEQNHWLGFRVFSASV